MTQKGAKMNPNDTKMMPKSSKILMNPKITEAKSKNKHTTKKALPLKISQEPVLCDIRFWTSEMRGGNWRIRGARQLEKHGQMASKTRETTKPRPLPQP